MRRKLLEDGREAHGIGRIRIRHDGNKAFVRELIGNGPRPGCQSSSVSRNDDNRRAIRAVRIGNCGKQRAAAYGNRDPLAMMMGRVEDISRLLWQRIRRVLRRRDGVRSEESR